MAYTDLTNTFGYKVRIATGNLNSLSVNDQDIINFIPWNSRTALKYLSATEVSFHPNRSGAPQETYVLFPDGHVVEAMQSAPASKEIFDITRTADLTTFPNVQGGLRSGLSEATNTWYAIYAVRSTFGAVMVGDTTLPLQANVATLNTRYGTNRWVYLGMIRNGDGNSQTGDIVEFIYVRDKCYFVADNDGGGANFNDGKGILLTSTTGSSLDWAYSAGVGSADLPNHIHMAGFTVHGAFDSVNQVTDSAGNKIYIDSGAPGFSSSFRENFITIPFDGVKIVGAASVDRAIFLTSFHDNVLGLGYNALI